MVKLFGGHARSKVISWRIDMCITCGKFIKSNRQKYCLDCYKKKKVEMIKHSQNQRYKMDNEFRESKIQSSINRYRMIRMVMQY